MLKTKGREPSNLHGRIDVIRKNDTSRIYDTFTVEKKYQSLVDPEGNCYDWYIIADHFRYEDKFTPGIGQYEQELTDIEITQIEQDQMITDHDIAIMELQEALEP